MHAIVDLHAKAEAIFREPAFALVADKSAERVMASYLSVCWHPTPDVQRWQSEHRQGKMARPCVAPLPS